jgi:TolB-like protein
MAWQYEESLIPALVAGGCAFRYATQTSLDQSRIKEEKIQRVAVLVFDSPIMDPEAGMHISRLFELNLLRASRYQIAERGEVEKILRQRGVMPSPAASPGAWQQMGDLLQVDGIILGSVSQYSRFGLAFTARLVSLKSGLVVWSVSQTGGNIFLPLGEVAQQAVRSAVLGLKAGTQ